MFEKIAKGQGYSRPELAKLWGYRSFHAIARGVVTPKGSNKIVLFVTEKKQTSQEQYEDRLLDGHLNWEGPTDHFAEDRITQAAMNGDEIHLLHRPEHHQPFVYFGPIRLTSYKLHTDKPSRFVFAVQ